MITSFQEFKNAYLNFDRITVYKEMAGDLDTPVSLLGKFLSQDNLFLLESAKENKTYSRFSFLSFGLEEPIILKHNGFYKNERKLGDLEYLKNEIKNNLSYSNNMFGNFSGGFVGYFTFEAVEKSSILKKELLKKPEILALLYFVEKFLAYDNYTNRLYLGLSYKFNKKISAEENFKIARNSIMKYYDEIMKKGETREESSQQEPVILSSSFSKKEFKDIVVKIKQLIEEGEAIQVVISNFIDIKGIDAFEFYRNLRRINPSPYMYFFKHKDLSIVGSSPEIHIKARGSIATMKPIAGTKPRGKTDEEVQKNKNELVNDEKEKAEHLMLVDLARNDLSRLAKKDSVNVKNFMHPEEFSHVIHLVSEVQAEIRQDFDMVDLITNTLPAGTLSGAPKVRAIEIIDSIEKEPRNIYGGCIGYIGFNNNMDMAITIRTAVFEKDRARFQAGAGIVYDSNPENEYNETINKLKALLKAGGINDSFDR